MAVSYTRNLRSCFRANMFNPNITNKTFEEFKSNVNVLQGTETLLSQLNDAYKSWFPDTLMIISADRFAYFSALSIATTWYLSFDELRKQCASLIPAVVPTIEEHNVLAERIRRLIHNFYYDAYSFGYIVSHNISNIDSEIQGAFHYVSMKYDMSPDLVHTFKAMYNKIQSITS